ncbi:MAG: energy transducer TonB [Acidobacteriota bacterium]
MRIAIRLPHPLAPGLPRMVLLSLAGHLVLGVLTVTVPGLLPRSKPPRWDHVVLAQLTPLPASLARPVPLRPAGKPSTAVRPVARPRTPPPPPKKPSRKASPRVARRPASPPPSRPAPARRASNRPPAAEASPGPPTAHPPGEPRASGIGISMSASSIGHSYYPSQLANKLRANWQRPVNPLAAKGPLSVRVRFRLDQRGNISQVQIEIPSSYPSLDTSALRAIRQAAPFPPLPPQYTQDAVDLAITFTLEPPGL